MAVSIPIYLYIFYLFIALKTQTLSGTDLCSENSYEEQHNKPLDSSSSQPILKKLKEFIY